MTNENLESFMLMAIENKILMEIDNNIIMNAVGEKSGKTEYDYRLYGTMAHGFPKLPVT